MAKSAQPEAGASAWRPSSETKLLAPAKRPLLRRPEGSLAAPPVAPARVSSAPSAAGHRLAWYHASQPVEDGAPRARHRAAAPHHAKERSPTSRLSRATRHPMSRLSPLPATSCQKPSRGCGRASVPSRASPLHPSETEPRDPGPSETCPGPGRLGLREVLGVAWVVAARHVGRGRADHQLAEAADNRVALVVQRHQLVLERAVREAGCVDKLHQREIFLL